VVDGLDILRAAHLAVIAECWAQRPSIRGVYGEGQSGRRSAVPPPRTEPVAKVSRALQPSHACPTPPALAVGPGTAASCRSRPGRRAWRARRHSQRLLERLGLGVEGAKEGAAEHRQGRVFRHPWIPIMLGAAPEDRAAAALDRAAGGAATAQAGVSRHSSLRSPGGRCWRRSAGGSAARGGRGGRARRRGGPRAGPCPL